MSNTARRGLAVANTVALAGTLVVNALSNALPLNGKTAGELSDLYPNLFVPAGITFSIWGVIYLALLGFIGYQLRAAFSRSVPVSDEIARNGGTVIERIGPWFIVSCLANAGWLLAWHYQLVVVSLLVMLALLGTLVTIYLRLGIGRTAASAPAAVRPPAAERYLVHVPFSIYLGWISIATIANVTAVLVAAGWNGFGVPDVAWAVALIGAGTLLGALLALVRRDPFYAAVVVWAFAGIVVARTAAGGPQAVLAAAIAGAGAVGVIALAQIGRRQVY